MSAAGTGRRSAGYMLLFLAAAYFVGSLMITVVNPTWDGIEDSELFNFSTTWGQDLGLWYQEIHAWIGLVLLLALLYTAFITTRDPT